MGYRAPTYFCIYCKTEKLWYKFRWGIGVEPVDPKNATCFDCEKKNQILVQVRIEKLVKRAMKNKISDLRNHLFETLEKVKDGDLSAEKAKSICEIAQVIINSVKTEIEYIKAIGIKTPSQFMDFRLLDNKETVPEEVVSS